jgi:hypothetical protein
MNIHYKIVEVWPNDHLIVARYWTDKLSEEFLASNSDRKEDGTPIRCRTDVSLTLPIPTPTGSALEKLILSNAPMAWLRTLESVQDPDIDTDISTIQNLVGVVSVKSSTEIQQIINPNQTQQLSDAEISSLIAKIAER